VNTPLRQKLALGESFGRQGICYERGLAAAAATFLAALAAFAAVDALKVAAAAASPR